MHWLRNEHGVVGGLV